MKHERYRIVLKSIYHFLVFFLLLGFLVTCCMTLFLNAMAKSMGMEFTSDNIQLAAKLTFGNVLLLTLIFTVIDKLRRRIMIGRPVKIITDAAQKLRQGDFTVRIPENLGPEEERFGEIASCFNEMARELAGTETLRTDFIANVSHELKTPLSVMQNYAMMLQQPGLSEEKRMEYAKTISEASRRLADLISNILKLNKLENQQIFPESTTYDLGEQLCSCMIGFETAWEEKSLEIESDMEENVLVQADGDMMALVWNNLISNAIKFTEPGGKISIGLSTAEGNAVVQISDTGCGISKEVGQHMFDKFYQGDTSHSAQGNGLGLALVKRVIDITGSTISVESEVGKGTTFTVVMRRKNHGTLEEDSV